MSKTEGKGATILIKKYKDTCRHHMILNVIRDVFRMLDPFDTTKTLDVFHHMACFTLLNVGSHMKKLRKTGYKHTIDYLYWSG